MMESISGLLNIPTFKTDRLEGKEYGQVKMNFIKNYGTLSNYNVPWKQLRLKKINFNQLEEQIFEFTNQVYILIDSSKTPIYEFPKSKLKEIFNDNSQPYDVDIYVYDKSFGKCLIYKGLFDKQLYITSPAGAGKSK
ncbi:hypothetical protein J8281_13960 [Aquimarina sp. U1-2]|uniref:hypothetical protein n=1 Tax=Aquimarina sp. U1-2 TaxID=2823141 RepID=UPI001AECC922|nr:hypothetical protein [Aquimarina sp. U1-2]MBP2833295.1 hypothetical protein [Aquimarina sp. U1-2]